MRTIVVITTIDSLEQARKIATTLVDRKLAACVQISSIESVYAWQGSTQNDAEFRLLVKTLAERYADVETVIRDLHTYDLPGIYALETAEIFGPYADWVADNSSKCSA